MTLQDADLAKLCSELDAFIHIIEMLAKCMQHTDVAIDPIAVQRLARVLRQHIARSVTKLYGL